MTHEQGAAHRVPFLDLARQYASLREEIDEAVARVLSRGWYVLGEEVAAFEREFAAYCDVEHAVGVNSGTDAIHLALRAVGVRTGDGVVTVPNVSAPTACAIEAAGARPVYVDVDPSTMNLDPESLRRVLKSPPGGLRVTAIVPVHLYGLPAPMEEIGEIAKAFGVVVVEDAAQGHGARWNDRPVGGLSAAGCFSFYPTKNLGAAGDAGAVVTNDAEIARLVRGLRNYGEVAKYQNRSQGFNSRLDEIQAAILRVKLRHLDRWVGTRRDLAERYRESFQGSGLSFQDDPGGRSHAYHLFVVRTNRRESFQEALKRQGVDSAIHYPTPLHLQESQRYLGYRLGDFPQSERACREVVSLPLYPELRPDEIQRVIAAALESAEESSREPRLGNP
ncbi:MAG: DegT/DnrJ/EryC1/StrS family aminotransferase [Isosphaeraceae bacterium]